MKLLTITKLNRQRLKIHLCKDCTIKKNRLHEARISSLTPKIIHMDKNRTISLHHSQISLSPLMCLQNIKSATLYNKCIYIYIYIY